MKLKFKKLPPQKIIYRNYSKFNSNDFVNDIERKIPQDENNLTRLNGNLEDIMNKHAPLKTKFIRGNNQAHVSKELRKEIMTRSRLKNKYNKSKSEEDLNAYKRQRNHIVSLNRKQKKLFFKNLSFQKRNNSKDFWNYCKPYFSNKATLFEEKITLFENDISVNDDKEIANIFNVYFKNITKSLPIKEWKNNNADDCDHIFLTHPSIKIIKSNFAMNEAFSFETINEESVLKIINQLDEKKSVSGKISTKLLKLAKTEILKPLTKCINTCIQNEIFPDELKLADVTPIFKKGDAKDKSNYRPISILPLLSKIFEKIIHLQLSNFFNSKLSKKLCGFREKHSTQHALFQLVKDIENWLDESKYVGMILMDLSKAYDCIPYDLLLAKMEAYGIDKKSLNLLRSYLSGRKQRVKLNSEYSSYVNIDRGVPQGSILGPLLFNIFLNDLLLDYKVTDICNFADDNTLYKSEKYLQVLKTILTEGVRQVLQWFEYSSMVANPEKFQVLLLGPRNKITKNDFVININDHILRKSETVRLLGITIDQNLTFKNHITDLCKSASNKLKALQRIRKYLTIDQTKMLTNAFIYSQFKYCNVIWMFCSKCENNKINDLHKRALRCIYKEEHGTLDYLTEKYQEPSFHERNIQSLMLLIYRVIKNLSPELLVNSFKEKKSSYSLRSKSTLQLPRICKTNRFGVNSIMFKGSLLWNYLPNSYKEADSESSFKNMIKKWKPKVCTCNICS